ncbi:trypsin-like serine protease [Frankia sp. R82]|uniref:trypsin-like serine protease n=1 Tax=Frankia sp. R82 TaxID=2950553 RepID=UPI0020434A7A|nr:trypsin-like serine protease [Frankia sp. R82]MCM3882487.1 trypsin-like serine protease [Frankia sp. R82]
MTRRRALRGAGLAAAAALLVAGTATSASAVADGITAQPGQYGYAVRLTMTNIPNLDGGHYDSACSAALIAPSWLITAGHCFHDVYRHPVSGPVPYPTTATIGRVDASDPSQGGHDVAVVAAVQSPGRDIALAHLAEPVDDVTPLALDPAAPHLGDILRIAGWGALRGNHPVPQTHLQTGQVQISGIAPTTVAVRGRAPRWTTSACPYDSGAPYVRESATGEPVLVAVESGGPTCPHPFDETASRIGVGGAWIRSIIAARDHSAASAELGQPDQPGQPVQP